jgi:hypothetical protein
MATSVRTARCPFGQVAGSSTRRTVSSSRSTSAVPVWLAGVRVRVVIAAPPGSAPARQECSPGGRGSGDRWKRTWISETLVTGEGSLDRVTATDMVKNMSISFASPG